MRAVLVLCAVLLAVPARGDDPAEWHRSDGVLEATYAALHLVDWSQTLYIAGYHADPRSPPPLWDGEANPILGRHPSRLGVHAYMAGTLAAHLAISVLLPRPYRSVWQCLTIGMESAVIGSNWTAGVRLSF